MRFCLVFFCILLSSDFNLIKLSCKTFDFSALPPISPILQSDKELNRLEDLVGMDHPVNGSHQSFEIKRQENAPWGLALLSTTQNSIINFETPLLFTYSYPELVVNNPHIIRVYVLDTGINDLAQNEVLGEIVQGWTVYENSSFDYQGHGTHVSGIISSSLFGVYKGSNVKLISVKTFNMTRSPLRNILKGFQWAINDAENYPDHSSIINLSLTVRTSFTLDAMIKRAIDKGIFVVTSAGNSGKNACSEAPGSSLPKDIKGIMIVGAICQDLSFATFSNFGECIDLFAPGCAIPSFHGLNGSMVKFKSGTSMAAPHVTGVVAMILSLKGKLRPFEIHNEIERYAVVHGAIKNLPENTSNKLLNIHKFLSDPS